jgi:predicted O-methyltransferase YrrM
MTINEAYQIYSNAPAGSTDIGHFIPYLREHAKGTILEIGVRNGISTAAFLLGLEERGGHLYSVDINPDCVNRYTHPQWTFIHADSKQLDVVLAVVPKQLDVLFIDGDHTREGYRFDLRTYSEFVKPGGIIISHDIDPEPNKNYEDLGPVAGVGWPSKAIREEYFAFAAEKGLQHAELPGMYGMGVITK